MNGIAIAPCEPRKAGRECLVAPETVLAGDVQPDRKKLERNIY